MSKAELGNGPWNKDYQPSGITRAEEITLEKYPHDVYGGTLGDSLRAACMVGYHQGKKDTIERAVKWLQEHAKEYIVNIGIGDSQELVVGGMCWVYLKQALEGEE